MSKPNSTKDSLRLEDKIGLPEGRAWSADHLAAVKNHIKRETGKQSAEQQIVNKLFAIKFRMEEYLERMDTESTELYSISDFLGAYLEALDLSFKKFATSIDTSDSNLKKYVSGERKFNTDLAMKFGCFFHTSPELWLRLYIKSEFIALNSVKSKVQRYKKYDYKKVVVLQDA
jgi:antitoxin HigA-1